jgi:hypothetical protein
VFARAVRPSDFSYKHKAERTVNLVLTPLSDRTDEGVHEGLRAALDASPDGTAFVPPSLVCESLMQRFRRTTDSVTISDVLVPPQHRAIEENAGADIGAAEVGY